MSVKVTNDRMVATGTNHHAVPVDGDMNGDAWHVSWLPGRVFTSSQATTAMVLASTLSDGPATGKLSPCVDVWAAELGVTRLQVVHAFAHAEVADAARVLGVDLTDEDHQADVLDAAEVRHPGVADAATVTEDDYTPERVAELDYVNRPDPDHDTDDNGDWFDTDEDVL